MKVDANIPLPERVKVKRDRQRRAAILKAYADEYVRLYVVRPNIMEVSKDGRCVVIRLPTGAVCASGSEQRIKQLTRNMRER